MHQRLGRPAHVEQARQHLGLDQAQMHVGTVQAACEPGQGTLMWGWSKPKPGPGEGEGQGAETFSDNVRWGR